MRKLFIPFVLVALYLLTSCAQSTNNEQVVQSQIDSLKTALANSYKPGFGDFMASIQSRHSKLWFAGMHENWELAEFEMHEIEEVLDDIRATYPTREETQSLPIIGPGLEAMNNAIKQRDTTAFKQGYFTLNNACNACHHATKVEFIHITAPTAPPFTNQDFKPVVDYIKAISENQE